MARIFYHTATGNIYGVHPGAFSGSLPDGIDFIDVAETPDQIVWLSNAAGQTGERYARVQGGVLVARNREAPVATGAQLIDEAKSRNKLAALLGVLTASERAMFYTKRRIVAGNPFAEVLRAKLSMSQSVMKNFIAAAALRSEV